MGKKSKDDLKNNTNMVWIDLEMTGLDPEKEVIIEIATIITDSQLNILEEGPDLVINQPNEYLERMDEWNVKQHTNSGLVKAVQESLVNIATAEKETLELIKKYCVEGENALCGNTVHHDRRFLMKYMPSIHNYLHYRIIDVSTIKTLVGRWYPKNKEPLKKGNRHRALADIQDSISELQFYRKNYFRPVSDFESEKIVELEEKNTSK